MPSTPTEAKTLKPIAFTTMAALPNLRNGWSMFLPATATYAPQHMPDCTFPLYAGPDVSSLLSLIEDMAKALEPFADQAETFDSDGKEFVPDQFEPAIVGHTIGDLRKSRSVLSRYTEFLRALSAQEGSK